MRIQLYGKPKFTIYFGVLMLVFVFMTMNVMAQTGGGTSGTGTTGGFGTTSSGSQGNTTFTQGASGTYPSGSYPGMETSQDMSGTGTVQPAAQETGGGIEVTTCPADVGIYTPNAANFSCSLARGDLYKREGRIQDAMRMYRNAVLDNPKMPQGYMKLAMMNAESGNNSRALAYAKEAARVAPNDPAALYNLGYYYLKNFQYRAAVNPFLKMTQVAPNNARGYLGLGTTYYYLKNYPMAAMNLIRAANLDPSLGQAHTNLGLALNQMGRFQQAIPHFREALGMNPNSYEAMIGLGNAYYRTGQYGNSYTLAQRILRVRPNDRATYILIGNNYNRTGDFKRAAQAYSRAGVNYVCSATGCTVFQ